MGRRLYFLKFHLFIFATTSTVLPSLRVDFFFVCERKKYARLFCSPLISRPSARFLLCVFCEWNSSFVMLREIASF